MDCLDLIKEFLASRGFKVAKGVATSWGSNHQQLAVNQLKKRGAIRVSENDSEGFEIIYHRNGHDRHKITIALEDPESLTQLLRFARTVFRVYG